MPQSDDRSPRDRAVSGPGSLKCSKPLQPYSDSRGLRRYRAVVPSSTEHSDHPSVQLSDTGGASKTDSMGSPEPTRLQRGRSSLFGQSRKFGSRRQGRLCRRWVVVSGPCGRWLLTMPTMLTMGNGVLAAALRLGLPSAQKRCRSTRAAPSFGSCRRHRPVVPDGHGEHQSPSLEGVVSRT